MLYILLYKPQRVQLLLVENGANSSFSIGVRSLFDLDGLFRVTFGFCGKEQREGRERQEDKRDGEDREEFKVSEK